VRGLAAQYSTTSSWPERQIEWVERVEVDALLEVLALRELRVCVE